MKERVVCILIFLELSSADLYAAVSELQGLLVTEARLIEVSQVFIKRAEEKLNNLKSLVEQYKEEHWWSTQGGESFLGNPINAFRLIKRIALDWENFQNLVSFEQISADLLSNITEIKSIMPYSTYEDFNGAANGLKRLQRMYDISTASLVKGEIKGIQYQTSLSIFDCYELGRHAYITQDFHGMKNWMTEVLYMLEKGVTGSHFTKGEILEYIAFSEFQLGNLPQALQLTEDWLGLFPDHPRALTNKAYYIKQIKNESLIQNQKLSYVDVGSEYGTRQLTENDLYKKACNKAIFPPNNEMSKLKCRYVHNNIPFLRLAPLKEEEELLNPQILLFRDVFSDAEIQKIKDMSQEKLQRARVEGNSTQIVSEVRMSKFHWITKRDTHILDNIYRRVEDMTGLSAETAEALQVVNYGIGGHYDVHEDYAVEQYINTSTITSGGVGNRIATVLFYLSDVEQGGATVFPNLHLAVWPEKGTALYWLNLHPDGKGDVRSRHAACPVLVGSKWVATVWLHEKGQEFRRPCELHKNVIK